MASAQFAMRGRLRGHGDTFEAAKAAGLFEARAAVLGPSGPQSITTAPRFRCTVVILVREATMSVASITVAQLRTYEAN